jgi:hypothetical protein
MMNEKLDKLRAVIAAECDRRMTTHHRLDTADVAEWLLRNNCQAVIGGLADLVCQVIDQWNDDDTGERILRAKPELRELEK